MRRPPVARPLPAPAALPALAALAVLLPAAGAAAQDVRWNFAEGDTHTYTFTLDADAEITQFGQTSENSTDLTIVQKWTVKKVNGDGSAEVDRKIERVKISSEAGETTTTYDSAAGDAVDPKTLPADFRVIAQLAGQTVQTVTAADGSVKEVTLPPAVLRAVEAAGPASNFKKEQVELLFTDRGYALPPAGAKEGDTYTENAVVPLQFGNVDDVRTMTLKSLSDEAATIALKTVMSAADGAAGGPMSVKSGATEGTIDFDVAAGRLAKATARQTIDLTGPGGFAIKLTSDSTFARTGD